MRMPLLHFITFIMCNRKLALEPLDIDLNSFYVDSYNRMDEDMAKMIL
jgi:hypothetical protein